MACSCEKRIDRPPSGSGQQQESAGHELRVLRTYLVQHGPETHLWWHRRQRERRGSQEQRNLRRCHRHQHLDNEWHGDQARQETREQQNAADDLEPTIRGGCEMRRGKSQLGETSHTLIRVNEFKDALPEKYTSNHQSQQEGCGRAVNRRIKYPVSEFVHCQSVPLFANCLCLYRPFQVCEYSRQTFPQWCGNKCDRSSVFA